MQKQYFEIKTGLGKRPTRVQMYLKLGKKLDKYLRRGWLGFLAEMGELNSEEIKFVGTAAEKFLIELEKTVFDKAYKIPTVLAFVTRNGVRPSVSLTDIGQSLSDFYHGSEEHQLDLQDKSNRNWRYWGNDEFMNLARRNPVNYLSKSRFFHYDDGSQLFQLDQSLNPYLDLTLAAHMKDIMEYRRLKYFRGRYRIEPSTLMEVAACQVAEEPDTESRVIEYNKLVRDKIPEIIEAGGEKCKIRTLNDEEYLLELNRKLQEELTEYQETGAVEELADLVEVAKTIARLKGISRSKFEEIMAKKREERGGFGKKVYLVKVVRSKKKSTFVKVKK